MGEPHPGVSRCLAQRQGRERDASCEEAQGAVAAAGAPFVGELELALGAALALNLRKLRLSGRGGAG